MKILITITMILVAATSLSTKSYATDLTDSEKEGIQLMCEEEKLAHDVYQFLYQKWGIPVFNNISNAETRHFDAVGYLLKNFEIEDPALPEVGKFTNHEITFLYDSLTQKGSETLTEALKVGAFIEEFDIADLRKLIAINSDTIIDGVYQNLLRGSNNHLRAFIGQLDSRNEVYTPIILSKMVFAEIVEGEHERGSIDNNCVIQENNCPGQQNKGKGRMRGRRGWN
ncbi:MAG: DUF2202 domain-containing protein [Draconibacterium sp.]|nr:DUF2202 domain-containing protein [Draconibacterium sp.]